MPIFFHAQAHLWIAYGLFFNGLLLHVVLFGVSKQYQEFTKPLECQVLLSFFFSLSINGAILLTLDTLSQPFTMAPPVLFLLSVVGLLIVTLTKLYSKWLVRVNWFGVALYAAMFVILLYNGGLIDQVSDAWWHISLANKIGWADSFALEYGHLTGTTERYYPPLWHANLALLRELSSQNLSILWNAFTAWGGVLKLMGYYLVGLALFKDRNIAMLGALLFALLPGFGNSYMRVSAWPSHISYAAWFFSIYIAFHLINAFSSENRLSGYLVVFRNQLVSLLTLFLLVILMYFLHQFELLLFIAAFCLYFCGLSLSKLSESCASLRPIESDTALFVGVYRLSLFGLLAMSLVAVYALRAKITGLDYLAVVTLPVALFSTLLLTDMLIDRAKRFAKWLVFISLGVLLLSLNYQHLASLFVPEMSLPKGPSHERPVLAEGWFGATLGLPGWHLQLRAGLLWSGVVGALISFVMVIFKPSREWVFISANCLFIWLLFLSPYMYQWFTDALKYHSVWRFGMLSFHPIAIAALVLLCSRSLLNGFSQHSECHRD